MKKLNILGKQLPVFVLALTVFAGLGSAAVVSYLSNTVTADVTVESPMEQWISDDCSDWTQVPITLTSIHGGDIATLFVKTQNNAGVEITGNGENIVTNWDGVTCADFASVMARTDSSGACPSGSWYDITSACSIIDDYHVKLAYGPTPAITWASGQVDITEIEATFNQYATGTYTFTSQVV